MKCKFCGKRITAERRKIYCSNECYQESRREEHRKPKDEDKHKSTLKKKEVCKGCKYLLESQSDPKIVCNYMEATGRSRIIVELKHGGVKAGSCICYEKKRKD